jgi:YgiT-type zinc finger domain-containing protein
MLMLGFIGERPIHVVAALDAESRLPHRDRLRARSEAVGGGFPDEEARMTCLICRTSATRAGATTVTREKGATTVVLKNVPAEICHNCGEYYLDDAMTDRVPQLANEAATRRSEIENCPIRRVTQGTRMTGGTSPIS